MIYIYYRFKSLLFLFSFLGSLVLFSGCVKKFRFDFEDGFAVLNTDSTGVKIDTSFDKIDKSLYEHARIFPGLVDPSERRIPDTAVTFDLKFTYVPPYVLGIQYVPAPVFSSGLYAAPGELIRISVPRGINGLSVQIGSQMDNLTATSSRRRDPVIYTVKELFPGNNYIRNPYGGYIWIRAQKPVSQPVVLHFTNVVKAPDFILGTTTDVAAWKEEVRHSRVPWLELRSEHAAFSVSRKLVIQAMDQGKMDHIVETMKGWNKLILSLYNWMGLEPGSPDKKNRAPELPERIVLDIQPLNSTLHGGVPVVAMANNYMFDQLMNIEGIQSGDLGIVFPVLFKSYRLVNSLWWSNISSETLLNLFAFYMADQNHTIPAYEQYGGTQVIASAVDYVSTVDTTGRYFTVEDKAYESNIAFIGRSFVHDSVATNQLFRITPFLQIAYKMSNPKTGADGWHFFPYLYAKARHVIVSNDDMNKRDFFYKMLSAYTHTNVNAFFDAWGIPLSPSARAQMSQTYPPMQKAVWKYNPLTEEGGDDAAPDRIMINRSGWSVTGSTEEPEGEGPPNGLTVSAFDGNPNTFWHSCWTCSTSPDLPFIITADMGQVNNVSGFYIASRYGSRRIRRVIVSVSNDGRDWIDSVAVFQLERRNNRQYFKLDHPMDFRYFKLTLPDPSWDSDADSPLGAIAEIGAFYEKE